ncbi:N-acetyltransferase family protein [Streptomyces sp. NPDC001100]
MSPRIRPAALDDLPALVRLDREVFPDDPYGRVTMRQFLDMLGAHFLVLVDGPSVCGYAVAGRRSQDPAQCWFLSLGIADEVRKQGLGTLLTRELMRRLRTDGVRTVWATVAPTNVASLALCTSVGFTPASPEHGVQKDYFGAGEDRLVLRLDLANQGDG